MILHNSPQKIDFRRKTEWKFPEKHLILIQKRRFWEIDCAIYINDYFFRVRLLISRKSSGRAVLSSIFLVGNFRKIFTPFRSERSDVHFKTLLDSPQ